MHIGIRPDWCIALRIVALHEMRRRRMEDLERFIGLKIMELVPEIYGDADLHALDAATAKMDAA